MHASIDLIHFIRTASYSKQIPLISSSLMIFYAITIVYKICIYWITSFDSIYQWINQSMHPSLCVPPPKLLCVSLTISVSSANVCVRSNISLFLSSISPPVSPSCSVCLSPQQVPRLTPARVRWVPWVLWGHCRVWPGPPWASIT